MPRFFALCSLLLLALVAPNAGEAQTRDDQTVLGPGIYVFQTRITSATCGDASRTGFVSSRFVAIDGIPGHRHMTMRVLDSQYWSRWELEVEANGMIAGHAENERIRGENRFEVAPRGSRFTGTGTRTYQSGERRCSVSYDALLRRLDD